MSESVPPARRVPPPKSGHGRLYAELLLAALLLAAVVALALSNRQMVNVSWVFGSTDQALIWVLVATAVAGWLFGTVTTHVVRRHRQRRR